MTSDRKDIVGYCDGACKGNPGPGGWGAMMEYTYGLSPIRWTACGGKSKTTNQEMELMGMLELLRLIDVGNDITIHSDSQFVLKGLIDGGKDGHLTIKGQTVVLTGWSKKWRDTQWLKSDGEPVKHISLWKEIISACQDHLLGGSTLHFLWVKGHNGNEGNTIADKLANRGIAL